MYIISSLDQFQRRININLQTIFLNNAGNMEHDYFIITLSGYYHSKVAGLLGSYDNEPYNDLVSGDMAVIGNSFQVNKRCKLPVNLLSAASLDNMEAMDGYSQCAALFKNKASPLRACFEQVSCV